jgi:hypothetical protein
MRYEEKNAEIEITAPDVKQSSELDDPKAEPREQERHTSTDSHSPTVYEVKERMKAASRSGPRRPLAQLSGSEAALQTRSEALVELSNPSRKRPDTDLLLHQLTMMVTTQHVPNVLAPELRKQVVALYSALGPSDATDSILARLIMATFLSVMEAQARAARTANPKAIDVNLRHALNGTKAVINLIEARTRRQRPTNITVENVNVNSGVQTIVRNVKTQKGESGNETRSDASLDDEVTGD